MFPPMQVKWQIYEICRTLCSGGRQSTVLFSRSKTKTYKQKRGLSNYLGCVTSVISLNTVLQIIPVALEFHLHSILNRETLTDILIFLTLSLQIFQTCIFSFYEGMSTMPGLNKPQAGQFLNIKHTHLTSSGKNVSMHRLSRRTAIPDIRTVI